jgi:hypothetical protein
VEEVVAGMQHVAIERTRPISGHKGNAALAPGGKTFKGNEL